VEHFGGDQACLSINVTDAFENCSHPGNLLRARAADVLENFERSEIRNHRDSKLNSLEATDKAESKKRDQDIQPNEPFEV
jgi:hypothetical protein